MRFVDDKELSFCLTISAGIERDELLSILGIAEELPEPQDFDDFVWETHQPGKRGLLNVFEVDDLLVTVENNGYLGVSRRTIDRVSDIQGLSHYVACYYSSGNSACQYVEIEDGSVVVDFDPLLVEAPEAVADFFPGGGDIKRCMIEAVEYRMEVAVRDEWLSEPTTTYVINYRTDTD